MTNPLNESCAIVAVPVSLKTYFAQNHQPGFDGAEIVYVDPTECDPGMVGDLDEVPVPEKSRVAGLIARFIPR